MASKLKPNQWGDLVSGLLETILTVSGVTFDLNSLLSVCPPSQVGYILGEHLAIRLSGAMSDDCVYNAAVAADQLENLSRSSPELYRFVNFLMMIMIEFHCNSLYFEYSQSVFSIHRSRFLKLKTDSQFGWSVEYLCPNYGNAMDNMIDFLLSLEALHPDMRQFIGPGKGLNQFIFFYF